MDTTDVRRTACTRDCPDACGILVTVEDGRATHLRGDPDHPITRGFLCHRTSRFLERQYSADRLTTPLIRRNGQLRPASWEECLDRIADTMMRIKDESGGAAIFPYRCGGSLGMMKHVTEYFFQRFGPVTLKSGDVCSGAAEAAQLADFGCFDSSDVADILNSRTIFLWGKNVAVSNIHLLPLLKQARRNGAHVVLIDPVHSKTVPFVDQFVQPRAGSDAAIACGIAQWLFANARIDADAEQFCDGLEPYRELVFSRTIEQWAALADLRADDLVALAARYAERPTASLIGWGLQRRKFGATTIRTIDALAAVSGNLGIAGGGASFYYARRGAFDLSFGDEIAAVRTISEPLFGPAVLEANDPPIRMVWVYTANPVTMLPDSRSVAEALRSRELTVVVDAFLTDSAQCADIVLPTTTMLEEDDLVGAYGHHWLAEVQPVVAPPAGAKTDYEIIQLLAQRVGLGDEFSGPAGQWKQRILKRTSAHGVDLPALHQRPQRSPFAEPVLFADRRFRTDTGRVQLIRDLPDGMLAGMAHHQLRLAALSTPRAQSSQWTAAEQHGVPIAVVHPDTVAGARDGDPALIQSSRGQLRVELKLDTRQRRDIVLMEKGGWLGADRCANALIDAELTDGGECAVYYDTRVSISPLDSES